MYRLLLFVFAFGMVACAPQGTTTKIKGGALDLREWDFEKKPYMALDGEWEFYWKHFLGADIHQQSQPYLIRVPSSWTFYTVNQQRISGKGYAT